MTPEEIQERFEFNLANDVIVRTCMREVQRGYITEELAYRECINHLVMVKNDLLDRLLKLQGLTPKLYRMPDGSLQRFDVSTDLLEVVDLSEPEVKDETEYGET